MPAERTDEKRKYIRFEIPLAVEVAVDNKGHLSEKGRITDVSRNGMRLVVNEDVLNEKEEVDLRISLPGKGVLIPAKGEIIWKQSKDDHWEMGLRIISIDKTTKSDILEYAYRMWLENTHRL
ncbi:MAG: PilZ domain-containing protein [Candidatus Omnitrophica bacterium]|nr:PilZ domain-containing protein [Candidatus Omnitrophota bacterium]